LNISSIKNKEIKKVQDSIKNAKNILFVCKGNICRSPFAQKYIQSILPDSIAVLSCGYDTIDGRFSPPEAIAAAKKFGIDLSKHRSKGITENLVQKSQAIYVFDEKSRNIVISTFPSAKNKIFRLALLAEKRIPIIEDPFGGTLTTFLNTYQEIVKALNNLNK
jgi:protein-tyrosine-phosphatase